MASSRQNALSNRAAARRKTWLMTLSIKSNSVRSARSASLSESEWDWERLSAFFWIAMAVTAGGWELANKTEEVGGNQTTDPQTPRTRQRSVTRSIRHHLP